LSRNGSLSRPPGCDQRPGYHRPRAKRPRRSHPLLTRRNRRMHPLTRARDGRQHMIKRERRAALAALSVLSAKGVAALERYVEYLIARLDKNLVEVSVFGSVARKAIWPEHSPLHSDIDLLVLVEQDLSPDVVEQAINETYELFLFCGRQISPQFRSRSWVLAPPTPEAEAFIEELTHCRVVMYLPPPPAQPSPLVDRFPALSQLLRRSR